MLPDVAFSVPPLRAEQEPACPLTQAPLTQSSEPILFPKLRIYFADFPYLHYSNRPEAIHLGDLMRLLVRPGVE